MFRAKQKLIIIPQAEHLRLVGTLAMLWGNADFDSPPILRSSLIHGIGLHDRGYGNLDTLGIGEMSADDWMAVTRKSFYHPCSDPAADLIIKYHLRRLAGYDSSSERQALVQEFTAVINRQLQENSLPASLFDRIDQLTQLTDMISFDFCMDQPIERSYPVFPKNDQDSQVDIHYKISEGLIQVTQWPFTVPTYQGYLIGYQTAGYPNSPDPVILPYRLEPL